MSTISLSPFVSAAKEEIVMVAGHLEVKNGLYYCVLSFKDAEGKRKRVWIPTKLKEKGNKAPPLL